MKTITITTDNLIDLFDNTNFDTNLVVGELLEESIEELIINEDGTLTSDRGGEYKWAGVPFHTISNRYNR